MDNPNLTCIVKPEEFRNRKHVFIVDKGIKSKYESLLAKYECFNTLIYYHKGNTIKHTERSVKKHTSQHNYHMNSSVSEKRPSIAKKSFLSLWNTLNESNYDKISHRLKFMVNEDNVANVIKELINMSIIHNIYHKQFLSLIKDVIEMVINKKVALLALHNTISEFSEKYWLVDIKNDVNEYDEFCIRQKHKQKISNTVTILLEIIDIFSDVITIDDIWTRIVDAYFNISKTDTYYLDILLNIIIRICETKHLNRHIALHIMETIVSLEDYNESIKNDMKIKFLKEKANQSVKSCLLQCSSYSDM